MLTQAVLHLFAHLALSEAVGAPTLLTVSTLPRDKSSASLHSLCTLPRRFGHRFPSAHFSSALMSHLLFTGAPRDAGGAAAVGLAYRAAQQPGDRP